MDSEYIMDSEYVMELQQDLLKYRITCGKLQATVNRLERQQDKLQKAYDLLQIKYGKRERELLRRLWRLQKNQGLSEDVDNSSR